MPFGFGKKKEEKPKESAATPGDQPQQHAAVNVNNNPQGYGQPPPQQQQHGAYGQPQQQYNYHNQPPQGGQPQYNQAGPGVYNSPQQATPHHQGHHQPSSPSPPPPGHQPQYSTQQATKYDPAAHTKPVQAQPAANAGPTGGEPVEGTPVYGDDVQCAPILKTKFVNKGCKDVWALVIFLIQILITIIVAVYNSQVNNVALLDWAGQKETKTTTSTYNTTTYDNVTVYNSTSNATTTTQIANTTTHTSTKTTTEYSQEQKESLTFFLLSFFLSILLACVMMGIMRWKPVKYIWVANICLIILWCLCALFVIIFWKAYVMGIFLFLNALIHAFWLYTGRHRIPFTGAILKQALVTTHKNFGTYVMSFINMLVLLIYMSIFSLMAIPALRDAAYEGEGPQVGYILLVLLLLLLWFWTIQVMLNIVHVTTSGSVATWFFAGDEHMPPAPSLASAKRALSTSFGSICFGSLLVAILQVIKTILRFMQTRGGPLCIACASCLISCIESMLRYFNTYAFCYVAIYGMGYTDAAKTTWDLITKSLWNMLFNDIMTGPVLFLTSLLDSLVLGLIFWMASGSFALGLACFLVSYVVHELIFRVAASGITTMFVCIAEDEAILVQSNPLFYADLQQARQAMNARE